MFFARGSTIKNQHSCAYVSGKRISLSRLDIDPWRLYIESVEGRWVWHFEIQPHDPAINGGQRSELVQCWPLSEFPYGMAVTLHFEARAVDWTNDPEDLSVLDFHWPEFLASPELYIQCSPGGKPYWKL